MGNPWERCHLTAPFALDKEREMWKHLSSATDSQGILRGEEMKDEISKKNMWLSMGPMCPMSKFIFDVSKPNIQ